LSKGATMPISKRTYISSTIFLPMFLITTLTGCNDERPNQLNINTQQITLSGLSSGGYMATQFHYAHSDRVSGVAVLAAGPYYCAQGDIGTALSACVSRTDQDIAEETIETTILEYARTGKIAPLKHLQNDKVWLLHGKLDTTVTSVAAKTLQKQYQSKVNPNNIIFDQNQAFAHHFPTLANGTDCAVSESPFIGACGVDVAGEFLKHLYPTIKQSTDQPIGSIYTFDQVQLGGADADTLADTGYIYIPDNCMQGANCNLHISFHGCNQNAEAVGLAYVSDTGINNWADTNQLVVLYPQTKASMLMPMNPQACWDWWGYTSKDYATKDGPQVKAVFNMLENINQISLTPSLNKDI